MPRMPSLNALRTFEVAARTLSFTKAAERLCVSQAAVSQQIKVLEDFLSVALFQRNKNTLTLTPKGEQYYMSLTEAFEIITRATEELTHDEAPSALTVGVMPSFAMRWLIPRLADFQRLHPRIKISVRLLPNTGPATFEKDGIDAVIHTGGASNDFDRTVLFPVAICPVCSPRWLEANGPVSRPEDLSRHALLSVSTAIVDEWTIWLRSVGCARIPHLRGPEFDSYSLAWQAAVDGVGIAMGRLPLVAEDLKAGRLIRLFDHTLVTNRAWQLYTSRQSPSRQRLAAFRDWIVKASQAECSELAMQERSAGM